VSILISNNKRAQNLFEDLIALDDLDHSIFSLVIVQHLLPTAIPFLNTLGKHFHITAVIPKPKSIHEPTLDQLQNSSDRFPILHANRQQLTDVAYLEQNIFSVACERKILIFDVGGYFSNSIDIINDNFKNKLVGIVEDTENGHQKYERYIESSLAQNKDLPIPILSVARSPLKEPEDHLVGQAIVFSTESVLRENNTLLTNKKVLVIGYGRLGKSIANTLSVRNINVCVYDKDPIIQAQALAHGFKTQPRLEAISQADLIIGATGNKSLQRTDFKLLKHCSFVASVTSSDDEFDFGDLVKSMPNNNSCHGVHVFHNDDRMFQLIHNGNAINFLHKGVLGPYYYLVACELIKCMLKLMEIGGFKSDGIETLTLTDRRSIADNWLTSFGGR